jgi:hypothetical protein
MTELVGNHTGEFALGQPGNKRQPERKNQVIPKPAPQSAIEVRRGVDLAIQLDPPRRRRADDTAYVMDD